MLDYEAEYNNRARVPEHAEIFARWSREAEAFRAQASGESRAELGIGYGTGPRQIIDLFATAGGTQAPLAMFVHGGYWRSLEPQMFSHMARGLNARGVCVAVAGYDLCPQARITDIVGEIRQACLYLWHRFGRRVLVSGHSAGGHLAACMLATDWKTLAPDAPADLVPCAYSASGVFDLAPLLHVSMNADLRRCRRSLGRWRRAACSMPWWAGANRRNFCARAAASRRRGGRAERRPVTMKCRARTTSPCSTRWRMRTVRWWRGSPRWPSGRRGVLNSLSP
jgi:acetyl esterase/lipase